MKTKYFAQRAGAWGMKFLTWTGAIKEAKRLTENGFDVDDVESLIEFCGAE